MLVKKIETAKDLARLEGIMCGISSGSFVYSATFCHYLVDEGLTCWVKGVNDVNLVAYICHVIGDDGLNLCIYVGVIVHFFDYPLSVLLVVNSYD